MSSNQVRQLFLQYFQRYDHQFIPTSSLVPENDPTLLFTNAGMVPFKDVFLGRQTPPYPRACSAQRCVRAGGKHNDLDNVGYTARHHTFFEMLGNFSFGDYFKRQAIYYAWEFLTQELGLDPKDLWVTVYETDDEAASIWLDEIGVDPERFSRCGASENYWSMGDVGPCGPSTEIFFDHGPALTGDPPGLGEEGDRYVEIWNLVFMQYDRDEQGHMHELPKPCVDTGMGLERIAAVMQGVHDNYEIDIFQTLIDQAAALIGIANHDQISLRVIADHIRSTSFLIADGVTPTNEGRGYVLRRIIRRAIRHARQLGQKDVFFYKLLTPLIEVMGDAYPELERNQSFIETILRKEEQQFLTTLDEGMKAFESALRDLREDMIPGQQVFHLYDTYGFPPDLTADMARERGLSVDFEGFEQAMASRRRQSQTQGGFAADYHSLVNIDHISEFTGYEQTEDQGQVVTMIAGDHEVQHFEAQTEGGVVLNQTPFYAESGGQVGDTGYLSGPEGRFRVLDTQKVNQAYVHWGYMETGTLRVQETVQAAVDPARQAIKLNHSATHLLHAALRRILGEHAVQKGSLVQADRLRFDFVHFQALTSDELQQIEQLVNAKIRQNIPGTIDYMTPKQAQEAGAIALFQQRYGEKLRVLRYGDFSMEPCGGTHVAYTGEIGFFKIIAQDSVGSGIRRLEAATGEQALQWVQQLEYDVEQAKALLKAGEQGLYDAVQELWVHDRDQQKALDRLKDKMMTLEVKALVHQAHDVQGVPVIASQVEEADAKRLRQAVDQLKQQLKQGVVVLATVEHPKVHLVAGVTQDCTDLIKAGDLVNYVSSIVGGKGGGRPDLAQGGGNDPQRLNEALSGVPEWVASRLSYHKKY